MRYVELAADGTVLSDRDDGIDPPPDPTLVVLDAITAARAEVARLSQTGATAKSIYALCDAVESLVAPA